MVAGMTTDIANSLLNKLTWDLLYSAGQLSLEYIKEEFLFLPITKYAIFLVLLFKKISHEPELSTPPVSESRG